MRAAKLPSPKANEKKAPAAVAAGAFIQPKSPKAAKLVVQGSAKQLQVSKSLPKTPTADQKQNADGKNAGNALTPRRRAKREIVTATALIAFGVGIVLTQVYKNFDLNLVKYIREWRIPKSVQQEIAFVNKAKHIAVEGMSDAIIPRIRRLFEQHYIHWHYKQNKPAMVPSEFVAGFDIKLSHRQTYLLDCFIYDWEKDTEQEQREELDGQDPDSAMVGLIEVVSRKCQNVGEFVKDVPNMLKPLSSHSQFIAFLEEKTVPPMKLHFVLTDEEKKKMILRKSHTF